MEYYGKYRGKVVNNMDPMNLGRLIVLVPAINEFPLSWAMPCVPYAGKGVGFLALPSIATNIWVEFEGGDSTYPIWTGCFWGEGELPAMEAPGTFVFKTNGVTVQIKDNNEGIEIKTPPDCPISLNGVNMRGLP